jgi:integrase
LALRRQPSPSREALERAASQFFSQLAAEIDQPRPFDPERFDEQLAWNVECTRNRRRELDEQLAANTFDDAVKLAASKLVAGTGSELARLSDRERLFALQLAARAERQQMQLLIHNLTHPHKRFTPDDQVFADTRPQPAAPHAAQPVAGGTRDDTMTLRQAVTIYLRRMSARRLGQSHVNEVGRALAWLQERHGDTRPVGSITKAELRKFRDDICRVDVTLRGRSAKFDARLTHLEANQIASETAQRYWRSVQNLFAWAWAEGLAPHDPSAGLKLEARRGEVRRSPPPFSMDELRALFQTPLYAGYLSAKRVGEPGDCRRREGHWWSGILLMYTGMRAGELSQLLPGDFVFDADVPHVKVREEDERGKRVKSTKNAASVRDVPLAADLLELGLREFVEDRQTISGHGRIFRVFRLGTQGRVSDGLTKFWGNYLRKFGLWKPGRSTHVWRHTLVACLRQNDVSTEDIGAFVGHTQGTITASYGGAYPLSRKSKTAARLDYGFDIVDALGGPYVAKTHG